MRRFAAAPLLFLGGCVQSVDAGARATRAGDIIGSATMAGDRSIRLALVSTACGGTTAHGEFVVQPGEPRHAEILNHVGGLAPGQTRPVRAWPTPPCP